jgi:RNA polymerase sigma-70 factor (ECF subfamily)
MDTINNDVYWVVPWLAATATGPATSLGLANPFIHDKSMSETSDLKHTKDLETPFLKSIAEHHGIIHKICRAYCNNRADHEDLYQEIVYQLWKFYPSFKGDSQFSTWMYAVALRSAILPFRRKRVRIELHDVLPDRLSDTRQDSGIDDRLFKLFHRLENIDRAVLVLMMEGFAGKEIGAVLGLTQKAVTVRMSRIRDKVEKS